MNVYDEDEYKEFSLDILTSMIEARGIPAYVEQTGGGCATIMIGETTPDGEGWHRYEACAGPGWFTGPGWTGGRAVFGDFCWGLDDQGESDPIDEPVARPLTDIADDIVAFVLKNRGEVTS